MQRLAALFAALVLAAVCITCAVPQTAEAGWMSRMLPRSWQKNWVKPKPRPRQVRTRRPRMDGPSRRHRALRGRNTNREESAWDTYQDQVTGDALKRGAESLAGTDDERTRSFQRSRPGWRTPPRRRHR